MQLLLLLLLLTIVFVATGVHVSAWSAKKPYPRAFRADCVHRAYITTRLICSGNVCGLCVCVSVLKFVRGRHTKPPV